VSEHRSAQHPLRRAFTVAAFTAAAAVALVAPTWLALYDRDTTKLAGSLPAPSTNLETLSPASSTNSARVTRPEPPSSAPNLPVKASSGPVSRDAVKSPSTAAPTEPATSPPLVGAISTTAAAKNTVAALTKDHWSTLPTAPIAARADAAAVWTGRQMLIWGGENGVHNGHLMADGAGYDPSSKVWTTLPTSPLTARTGTASAWTGTGFFVWGGFTQLAASSVVAKDGALYNPSTNTWRRLPAAPLSARGQAQAVVLDGLVYVVGGRTPTGSEPPGADAAVFDPATNAWTVLPDPPATPAHEVADQIAAGVNGRLEIWQLWSHVTALSANSETVGSGIDAFSYNPATRLWSGGEAVDTGAADGPHGIDQVFWTGQRLVLAAASIWCGACTGPPDPHSHGYQRLPGASGWTAIPQGPVDEDNALYQWTGSALIGYDGDGHRVDRNGAPLRGGMAAWDPVANNWTSLPDVPLVGEDVATVWTGSQLLEWGEMYDATTVPRDSSPVAHDAGLSFGP
jgi:hypothetical protein